MVLDLMIPWRSLLVFLGISVGTTTAIAILSASMGWTVHSPAWGVLAPIAMWAPALGRFAARRTVDRGFISTLPLSEWGATGAQVILWPLAAPLAVYSAAYAIAWSAGFARWSPGGGNWTTGPQLAVNLLVNLHLGSIRNVHGSGRRDRLARLPSASCRRGRGPGERGRRLALPARLPRTAHRRGRIRRRGRPRHEPRTVGLVLPAVLFAAV